MAGITAVLERIVQAPHKLGRLDIDRVLVSEGALLYTYNEAEGFDIIQELRKSEVILCALLEIVEFKFRFGEGRPGRKILLSGRRSRFPAKAS